MVGHAVVGPAREVKLPYLPDLVSPSLRNGVIVLNTHSAAVPRPLRIQSVRWAKDPSKKTNMGSD